MNRYHCVLHTDRLYVVHHSFPITSSSILVRYMMTTKVSYQLVLMIFQFPKCGSCGFDGSHIFGCASDYHTYLVDPFFLTPTETICTSKPPFLTLGEKMRHAHFSQTSSKDSGTFFCYPCRASNSLVCQSIHFNIFDKHVFRCLITRIQSISPKNKFIIINFMVVIQQPLTWSKRNLYTNYPFRPKYEIQ